MLRADLSKHVPVQVEGVTADRAPKVATSYRLYFRQSRTSVTFTLDRPQLRSGSGSAAAPNDRSFSFPGERGAGVSKVIQVDEHAQGAH